MNIFAQITDGLVSNTAVWAGAPPKGWIAVPDIDPRPGIGWGYDGGNFVPPIVDPAEQPIPEIISDRQFAQALAQIGLISQDEALAWVKVGTLPAALQSAVDAIPDARQKFATEMLLSGATTFERHHPMVTVLRDALQKTDADLDAIWTLGASL